MNPLNTAISLQHANHYFTRVATGDDPLAYTYQGVSEILRIPDTEPASNFPEMTEGMDDLLQSVAVITGEAASRWIERETIDLGLVSTAGLLLAPDHPLRLDYRWRAALLCSSLSAAICQREIASRGDPLVRSIAVARAWNAHNHQIDRVQ